MKARKAARHPSALTSLLLTTGSLALLLSMPACGGNEDSGDGDGDGATTGGTSGDGGTGTGGDGNGGDGTGGVGTGGLATGGDGTGGDGTGGDGTGGDGTGGDGTGGMSSTAFNCDPPTGDVPVLGLEVVASGFDEPVLVTHAGDERLFVVERGGEIQVIDGGMTLPTPFLVVDDVDTSGFGERGLLGLAFHPDHAENGLLYIYYTQEDGAQATSRVVEYAVMDGNPNEVDTSTERELLAVAQPEQNHNGGTVEFGPDGMLYWALGDGGMSGDQNDHGQDVTTWLSSLLRIDVDGRDAGAYSIPAGNLSEVNASAAPEVFSYGFRNPYRFNFDPCTGDLYIGDVGETSYEEVTITNSGVGQLNYGWSVMEGNHCFPDNGSCDMTGITQPQIEYERGGGAAVIGGSVYRGSAIPALRGQYIYSDTVQGHMNRTTYDSSTGMVTTPINFAGEFGGAENIVSIQNGYDGEIYVTNRVSGEVLQLVEQVF